MVDAGTDHDLTILPAHPRLKRRRSQEGNEQLLQNLSATFKQHPHFVRAKGALALPSCSPSNLPPQIEPTPQQPASFGIVHYAGTIAYNASLLAKKNKDTGNTGMV